MRFNSKHRFGCFAGTTFVLFLFFAPSFGQASQFVVSGRQSLSNYVPGAFVGFADPATGSDYYANTVDPFWGDPLEPYYSCVAVLDTGASGHVISAYEANARNLPLTTETFSDVGIGGSETFNVSQTTRLKLASVAVGITGSEEISNFSSYGDYKFQIRQTDPLYEGYDPVFVNVIGTPVLNQYVMHVTPNGGGVFSHTFDYFGGMPVEYLPTELLASAPSGINATSSELVLIPTTGGALHVPLSYQNFISGSAPVSTSTNPMISGVQVIDGRKPLDQQSTPSDWLFDTGGMATMIGRNLATSIGIDLDTEEPAAQTTVLGIGGDVRTFYGYQVDQLVIPMDGGELVFTDIVVFVPGVSDLPADLPGIFGMNLINKSFNLDPLTQQFTNFTNSAFSDWYVVPVPEPGSFVLLTIGVGILLLRRYVRRRR